jgi:ribose/xylose/arabinose/galactoside ABC-type transport system permease subunit
MWISRPLYELLPYLYMLLGAGLLAAAYLIHLRMWPSVFLTLGALSLMAGLVLWLRRKDYRAKQAEYDSRSLDDKV